MQLKKSWILGAAFAVLAASPAFAQEKITVWWEKGFYKAEDDALFAVVKKFEEKYKIKVDLSLYANPEVIPKTVAALDAGNPPDVGFGNLYDFNITSTWAYAGKLEDITSVIEPLRAKFEPRALSTTFLLNNAEQKRAYYAFPIRQQTMHIQYWKDMLGDAGFKESDIPTTWKEYWSFWCDKVQPAYRQKTGNRGFGTGFPMGVDSSDAFFSFLTFMDGYNVKLVSDAGKVLVDDPTVRQGLINALTDYTAVYSKGCTPPSSTNWRDPDNNVAFGNKTIVMTHNATISIAAAQLDASNNASLTEAQRAQAKKNYTELIATAGFPTKPDGTQDDLPCRGQDGRDLQGCQEQGRGEEVRRLPARGRQPHALHRGFARALVPGDQGRAAERILEVRPAPPGGLQPVHGRHDAFRVHEEPQVRATQQRERVGQGDEPHPERQGAGGQGRGRDDRPHQDGGGELSQAPGPAHAAGPPPLANLSGTARSRPRPGGRSPPDTA